MKQEEEHPLAERAFRGAPPIQGASGTVPYYTANPNYILREIAGEVVLVSVGGGVADFCGIVTLNPSAAALWELLQKGAAEDELVRALMECFSVSEQTAAGDVKAALALLEERRLIRYG